MFGGPLLVKVEPEHWRWRVWLVDEELDKKGAANSTEILWLFNMATFNKIPY